MNKNSISILGCGWLGLPLAISWLAGQYTVKGSATSFDKASLLASHGIKPSIIDLKDVSESKLKDFLQASVLVVSVPPRTRTQVPGIYMQQIQKLANIIQQVDTLEHVIYTSSTSVYKDGQGVVREEDVYDLSQASNQELFEVEQLFLMIPHKKVSVLRLAGLTGGTRMLARHFAGKQDLRGGAQPVNLVHVEDAVGAIKFVVAKGLSGTFNVCAPAHPTKKDFYTQLSLRFGLEKPSFNAEEVANGKTVDSTKLSRNGYTYAFPDPYLFSYEGY